MTRLRALWRRLRVEARGMALVEFAFVLPVLLTLYMAGYQISEAIACNRKVTITARAVADLTSQFSKVTANELDTVLGASSKVMVPFDSNQAMVRVTEVTTDWSYTTRVVWSRAINGTAYAKNSTITIPTTFKQPTISLIYAEVAYSYVPAASFGFIGPRTLTQSIYMLPRASDDVPCDDCV